MDLFLSFEGRIARGRWWLGVIVLLLVMIGLNAMIAVLFGGGFIGSVLALLVTLAAFYPVLALATKRLADRGKPPMPRLAFFYGPAVLMTFMSTFNIGYRPMSTPHMEGMPMGQAGATEVMVPGAFAGLVGLVALIAGIWALVELGFLRGDAQDNAYGPAPQ